MNKIRVVNAVFIGGTMVLNSQKMKQVRILWMLLSLMILVLMIPNRATLAQPEALVIRQARTIGYDETGILNPIGLAFGANDNLLRVVDGSQSTKTEIFDLTLTVDAVSSMPLNATIATPINMATDNKLNRLLFLSADANTLNEIAVDADDNLDSTSLVSHPANHFGLQEPQGMAIDPETGHLLFLDANGPRLVRVVPETTGDFAQAVISEINLQAAGIIDPVGLALNPTTKHFYLFSRTSQKLYELTQQGSVVATWDLTEFAISNPQGMVIAPSGDQTDDPTNVNLYLTDSGIFAATYDIYLPLIATTANGQAEQVAHLATNTAHAKLGRIIELSFERPVATPRLNNFQSALVQAVDLSQFSPPSPDSSGIVYIEKSGRFLISDSEVNEMPALFTGDNLFDVHLAGTFGTFTLGSLVDTLTTIPFSDEPTGVTYNPANEHLFFSDDTGPRTVYELDPGPDQDYDTLDDIVTSFRTGDFGSTDPEGVAYDTISNVLFIIDGLNREVYRVDPGSNGLFDGVAPLGDDQVTNFDTLALGINDPEGITFNPDNGHLYLIGNPRDDIAEVTTSGTLVRIIDVSAAHPRKPAGLAYGPSSASPGEMNMYIVARGVDNDTNPTENDGMVFEVTLPPPPDDPTLIYVSSSSGGTVNGIVFTADDILAYDTNTQVWSLTFDASDVGISNLNAFELIDEGNTLPSILLSVAVDQTISGLGSVDNHDIIKFVPSSLGGNTTGAFDSYLVGIPLGLDSSGETISAITFDPTGRLLISTDGNFNAGGVFGRDEDLYALNPDNSWELYFDGSDPLLANSSEEVWGAWVEPNSGQIYLTTKGNYVVSGLSGSGSDIFVCQPGTLGSNTSCTFIDFWRGADHLFAGELIDGLSIAGGNPNSGSSVQAIAQDITVQLNASGNVTINASDIDNGSTVSSGIPILSLDQTSFTCANVGPNTVTLMVSDNSGNTDTAQATVTVEDNIAPNAIAQNITVNLAGASSVTISPNTVDNGSNDVCGIALLTLDQDTFLSIGNYPVALTVTDTNGNTANVTAIVTVVDVAGPVAVAQAATVQLDASGNAAITGSTIDGGSSATAGIVSLTATPNTFTCTNVGTNLVTLTVLDTNGLSDSDVAIVTVEDNVPPVALAQNMTVNLNGGGTATITPSQIDSGSNDACGIATLALDKTSFTTSDLGDVTVTLTVTDNNGNSATTTATVTVEPAVTNLTTIYLSSSTGGTVEGISFTDDDILAYDTNGQAWSLILDASDVGINNLNAFEFIDEGNVLPSILLSVASNQTVAGLGSVDKHDIIKFVPTTLGDTTSGTFSSYLVGIPLGLASSGETISAITFAPDGRLLISTDGNFSAGSASGRDEDLFALNPDNSWELYFDGSDVNLASSAEETWGAWVEPNSGDIYLTSRGHFGVSGVTGSGSDIFVCQPGTLGNNTSCAFSSFWQGVNHSFNGEIIDGLSIE